MNTSEHTQNDNNDDDTPPGAPSEARPLGYWLRTVDALLTREFAVAFDGSDISRREWMLLTAVSGDITLPGLAERLARKGKHLRGLVERGWVQQNGDGSWTLTDQGREAKARIGVTVDGIRARVSGAVPSQDLATTITSLEAIARELGWDESNRMPRRRGFGRGFGSGFGPRGFGPEFGPRAFGPRGFGPGFAPGFGSGFGPARHDEHHGHHDDHRNEHCARGEHRHGHGGAHRGEYRGEHRGHDRHAEHAYERGFDAGFARGRAAAESASDAA